MGGFSRVEVGGGVSGRVDGDSVWRFKGLERPVAVLVEFAPETSDQLRYTALTRASSHAVIIGTPEMLAAFRRDGAGVHDTRRIASIRESRGVLRKV